MKLKIKHIFIILIILLICTAVLTSYRKKALNKYFDSFRDFKLCNSITNCKRCLSTAICAWSPDDEKCVIIPQNATGLYLTKSKCGDSITQSESSIAEEQTNTGQTGQTGQTGAALQAINSGQSTSDNAKVISGQGPSAASIITYSAYLSNDIAAKVYADGGKPLLKTEGGLPPIIQKAAKQRELVHPSSKR